MTADGGVRFLALGAPRSGFVLLCSLLSRLAPMTRPKATLRQCLLDALVDAFGDHIANGIVRVVGDAGRGGDLVFSPAFRIPTGGPKWLEAESDATPARACVRKYVGVRGLGDFTLVTSHPREILDYDEVIHSHVDPRLWSSHPGYAGHCRFASIRNPIGTIASAMLSLNALTSTYLQHVLPDADAGAVREGLARYKFTDPAFFEGLVRFYRRWFDDYLPVRGAYTEMRWEDLLTRPADTIGRLAARAGLPVDGEHAGQIWEGMAHRNLTGAHRHNFREGGGMVGDWRRWMTNHHLEILRAHGFDAVMDAFGYDPIPTLDESAYTPFQREAAERLSRGEIADPGPDRDLFRFAFNKSNIESSGFAFKSHGWKAATRIERSDFSDEPLMMACWEAADAATVRLNAALAAVLAERWDEEAAARASLARVLEATAPHFAHRMPHAFAAVGPALHGIVTAWFAAAARGAIAVPRLPPRLIRAVGTTNIVAHQGRYFAIPQAAGPLDLATQPVESLPGVVVRERYADLLRAVTPAPAASI